MAGRPPRRPIGTPLTRILLVRHGESEWNASGRWQGQADPPLTERGRRQAAHASRSIGTVDAIVSSDLERARTTAQIIAAELGLEPVYVEAGLRERDVGEWSGLTRAEIHAQWPGYLADDPATTVGPNAGSGQRRPPGWEDDDHLWERVVVALRRMAQLVADGHVVAVTHGGVVYAVEARLSADGRGDGGRLANLAGRWIEIDGDGDGDADGHRYGMRLGERVLLVDPDETVAIERDRI